MSAYAECRAADSHSVGTPGSHTCFEVNGSYGSDSAVHSAKSYDRSAPTNRRSR
jgi:hypothetical protein